MHILHERASSLRKAIHFRPITQLVSPWSDASTVSKIPSFRIQLKATESPQNCTCIAFEINGSCFPLLTLPPFTSCQSLVSHRKVLSVWNELADLRTASARVDASTSTHVPFCAARKATGTRYGAAHRERVNHPRVRARLVYSGVHNTHGRSVHAWLDTAFARAGDKRQLYFNIPLYICIRATRSRLLDPEQRNVSTRQYLISLIRFKEIRAAWTRVWEIVQLKYQ